MKKKKHYVITKSNPALTQSGMLALLLQRQRSTLIELAQRRAHREHVRAAFESTFNRLLARALRGVSGRSFRRDLAANVPRHT